ncbi:MAG: glycosyltransferase [Chitinophagales bacterium]|nr:glycosyltransferase [Chitinophagales bacterium]
MKIAIIGPAYPYRGGIANFNERLAQQYYDENDTVVVYTFKMMYPNFLFPGKSQVVEEERSFAFNIIRCINAINPLNWIKVAKQISQEKYDIVLVAFSIPFLAPALASIARLEKRKNINTKIIGIIHNLFPHEKRIGDKLLTNYFMHSLDYSIALSNKVEKDIKNTYPALKVNLLQHPIYDIFGEAVDRNMGLQQLGLNNVPYLLFFGLIRAYKGLDLLLEAMQKVIAYDASIHLIVAGEFYDNIEEYKSIIEKNNLEKNIIIYNEFIPEEKVKLYFSVADAVVQPYKKATQSGITQICYHFNTPMIATNVGGLPETIPNNVVGLICEPNTDDLATTIIQFYSKNKAAFFRENIKLEKQKYSWHHFSTSIQAIVNDK